MSESNKILPIGNTLFKLTEAIKKLAAENPTDEFGRGLYRENNKTPTRPKRQRR
jgi:hypothetical protein